MLFSLSIFAQNTVISRSSSKNNNVSAEILKVFYLVEVSMLKSGRNIDERNKQILAALKKEVDKQPEKQSHILMLQIKLKIKYWHL